MNVKTKILGMWWRFEIVLCWIIDLKNTSTFGYSNAEVALLFACHFHNMTKQVFQMSTYNKSSLLQSNNVLNLVMYNFFPCHGYMITLTMQLR